MKDEYDMKKAKRGAVVAPVGKTRITFIWTTRFLRLSGDAPRPKDAAIKP